MVSYLLNVVYLTLLIFVSPILLYRSVRYKKYREGFAEKLLGRAPILAEKPNIPRGSRRFPDANDSRSEARSDSRSETRSDSATCSRRIWFHAVSVGEMNLLKPILKRLGETRPDWEIVISTTSKTGMQLGRKLFPDRTLFYCPLDFSWATRNAMKRIRPDLLVLVELELWPNLIAAARKVGAKVAIVNGRISDASFSRYRRVRFLLTSLFRKIDLVAAQDRIAADYFRRIGVPNDKIQITGSIKFDGVQTDRANSKTRFLANLARLDDSDVVFLVGSSQDPEEAIALETFRKLLPEEPNLRLVLVPRHPERFDDVAKLLNESGFSWSRRSELKPANDDSDFVDSPKNADCSDDFGRPDNSDGERSKAGERPKILLVDSIGELGAFWGRADVAFVGGSFGKRGGQNMIEPAAYGAAVSFGPNTKNFRDIATTMIQANAAVVVSSEAELTDFVRRCLTDPQWKNNLGENARKLVLAQQGATDRTLVWIERLFAS